MANNDDLNLELENYFRNTIIPQLFVDAQLILRKYTPPAMKQFNFEEGDIGKSIIELGDNIKYSTIIENIKEVMETGEVLEKDIQTTDMRWYQMNIIPYVNIKTDKTNGVIITFVDITNRINYLKEFETLNSSFQTFILTISHDLKAPLVNIEGLVKYLNETVLDNKNGKCEETTEQKNIATMLDESVKVMHKIIDEVTEFAKIEFGYAEKSELISFENVLKEVELILKDMIFKTEAKITTELNQPTINYSRKHLRSIFYNLISNSLKYRSPDRVPEISIQTEKENGFMKISIKDNGIGIKEEDYEKLFKQYSRLEKEVEGTGIGLYLVKKIIENSEGKIEMSSKKGKGSEFTVYLKENAVIEPSVIDDKISQA